MKRYLFVLLLTCSPAMAQTPEMVTQSTAPTTTIVTTGPVTIGTCKEAGHSHDKKAVKRKLASRRR